MFLNSTLIDQYFRQFNGHTQVNATDLRNIHYPTKSQLTNLGQRVVEMPVEQQALDALLEEELYD
jgi:adenine-specific DNA-methyltransferase